MDKAVKMVAQKTGLSEDKAKVAVETVIGFPKDKLPGQIDGVPGDGVAAGLGGMFGKKG